jgi:ribosomal protein S6
MTTYELTYIISPEATSEEAEAKSKEIESLIQGKEGSVLKQTNPIARTLSYPIKKHASGFWGVLEFQVEPEKVIEIKETIAKDVKIVRNMIIIKGIPEMKKERRTRTKQAEGEYPVFETKPKPEITAEEKTEAEEIEKPAEKSDNKGKVELKDIEQKLDELLGE